MADLKPVGLQGGQKLINQEAVQVRRNCDQSRFLAAFCLIGSF